MFGVRHPFFLPLLPRLVVTVIVLVWTVVEFVTGSVGFGIVFGAIGAYCVWEFFITFDPDNYTDPEDKS